MSRKESNQNYYAKNKDKCKEYQAKYYAKNRDRLVAYQAEYNEKNRERRKQNYALAKAKMQEAIINEVAVASQPLLMLLNKIIINLKTQGITFERKSERSCLKKSLISLIEEKTELL